MSIGKLGVFDVKCGVWSSYQDRMDMYFKVNYVEPGMQLPTMIASMGDEAYELLVNLASPSKPSDLSYADATQLMRDHLQPTPSALAERYRFRQKRQGPVEDVATFVAELKKLSRNCKFGSNLNENLRDQFVCGLRSDVIRQRLFAEDDSLTFSNAVRLASSLEAAERDAAEVEGPPVDTSSNAGALHVLTHGSGRGGQPRGRGSRGVGRAGSNGKRRAGGSGSVAAGFRQAYCGGCGANNHDYGHCRYRDFVCSKCQRTGHLRRVCPERESQPARGGARQSGYRDGNFHFSGAIEGESSGEDVDPEESLNLLALNKYKAV